MEKYFRAVQTTDDMT